MHCVACQRLSSKKDMHAYYLRHKEAILSRRKAWYLANSDKVGIARKKYREKNKDIINAKERETYWTTGRRAANIIKGRQRHKNNPNARNERRRRWAAENREEAALRARRKRFLKKARGSFSVSDIKRLLLEQRGRCYWCFSPLNGQHHIDHFIPLSRSGSNTIENLVISCPSCNIKKSDKMPWEFCDAPFARTMMLSERAPSGLTWPAPLG